MKFLPLLIAACCVPGCALATPAVTPPAPDLDLSIQHYSKVLTPEGVTREVRYEEKMVRRSGHVWIARVLPTTPVDGHEDEASNQNGNKTTEIKTQKAGHHDFNHVLIPRHVLLENNKMRVEYIDVHDKVVVAIPAAEYANVNFDGSWENAYYLLDPRLVNTMPRSARSASVPGAHWREREKNGAFQRILWDDRRQIPLVIESGDRASTFYRRIDVKPQAVLTQNLPWQNLKGYAQKEYSDFLD